MAGKLTLEKKIRPSVWVIIFGDHDMLSLPPTADAKTYIGGCQFD